MSHYTRVTTKISRKSCLVKALMALGFRENQIEVSDSPMALKTYSGGASGKQAQVRIKGAGWGYGNNHIGGYGNDMGFELQADGSYTLHVDEVGKYGGAWRERLMDQYAKATVEEIAEEQHYVIESTEVEGDEIVMRLTYPF